MASDGDILAAALLARASHDLRNKASALVGARDLLHSSGLSAGPAKNAHVKTAFEILGDGELEMSELADTWSATGMELYAPRLVTVTVEAMFANLSAHHSIPALTRLECDGTIAVRVDERVLELVLERVSARVEISELVVRREDGFGLSWLVLEAMAAKTAEVGRTHVESALLKMLDAHPLKKTPAHVFGFRLRLDES